MINTLAEILPNAARRYGDRTALIVEDKRFTFDDLDALSNRVANGLVAGGIESGDSVTLFGPNCWEWLVSYYGIVKTGAVVNPTNVMLTPEEVRHAVIDSDARVIIASSEKGSPPARHGRHGRSFRCDSVGRCSDHRCHDAGRLVAAR
jgi:long-chain acyl-CoA synthetase